MMILAGLDGENLEAPIWRFKMAGVVPRNSRDNLHKLFIQRQGNSIFPTNIFFAADGEVPNLKSQYGTSSSQLVGNFFEGSFVIEGMERPLPPVPVPSEVIENRILLLRGEKVLLDRHLAALYDVETRTITRAIRRNESRFPGDFAFQLSRDEWRSLKRQFGVSSWGGDRALPHVFTEQGIAMLSGILTSPRAVAVNIAVMRAFVRLRRLLASNEDFARRLSELEARDRVQDGRIDSVFRILDELMAPAPEKDRDRIGFQP